MLDEKKHNIVQKVIKHADANMKRCEFAKKAGMGRFRISQIFESGAANLRTLERLADAADVEIKIERRQTEEDGD